MCNLDLEQQKSSVISNVTKLGTIHKVRTPFFRDFRHPPPPCTNLYVFTNPPPASMYYFPDPPSPLYKIANSSSPSNWHSKVLSLSRNASTHIHKRIGFTIQIIIQCGRHHHVSNLSSLQEHVRKLQVRYGPYNYVGKE